MVCRRGADHRERIAAAYIRNAWHGEMLADIGISCTAVEKSTGTRRERLDVIEQGQVDS